MFIYKLLFFFLSISSSYMGKNTQCQVNGEMCHIVGTWGCCFHCSPVSSQFGFQPHPVGQHSSPLCWWLWQRSPGRSAEGRPSTMDYPHGQQCGCRTPGCSTSSVCHQWLLRQRQRRGSTTGWHGLSVPRWGRGTLEWRGQRAEMNAFIWMCLCHGSHRIPMSNVQHADGFFLLSSFLWDDFEGEQKDTLVHEIHFHLTETQGFAVTWQQHGDIASLQRLTWHVWRLSLRNGRDHCTPSCQSGEKRTEWGSRMLVPVYRLQVWNEVNLMLLPSFVFSDSPIQISAPLRVLLPSSRFVNMMAFSLYIFCRSTLHQGLDSVWVRVQELRVKFESLFPSTALPAAADSLVEDCSEFFPSARFWLRWPDRSKRWSLLNMETTLFIVFTQMWQHQITCQHSWYQHEGHAWVNRDVNLTLSPINCFKCFFQTKRISSVSWSTVFWGLSLPYAQLYNFSLVLFAHFYWFHFKQRTNV